MALVRAIDAPAPDHGVSAANRVLAQAVSGGFPFLTSEGLLHRGKQAFSGLIHGIFLDGFHFQGDSDIGIDDLCSPFLGDGREAGSILRFIHHPASLYGVIFHNHQPFRQAIRANSGVEMVRLSIHKDIGFIHISLTQVTLIVAGSDSIGQSVTDGPNLVNVTIPSENQFLCAVSGDVQSGVFHGFPEMLIGNITVVYEIGLIIPHLKNQVSVAFVVLIFLIELHPGFHLCGILFQTSSGLI